MELVNNNLIEEAKNFQPYNYMYVLVLERQALINMWEYFKELEIPDPNTIKDLNLAINLLDIILQIDELDTYVNIKNKNRYCSKHFNKDIPIFKNWLRKEKAWYLYNKLRFERMKIWWD